MAEETIKTEDKHIKIRVEGESFWALQLTENTAQVDNILLSNEVHYKDIVKFNPETMIVEKVIESTHDTIAIVYKTTEETIQEDYKKLHTYLKEKNMSLEGMGAGIALLAFPKTMTDDEIIGIMENTPIQTAPYGEAYEEGEDDEHQ